MGRQFSNVSTLWVMLVDLTINNVPYVLHWMYTREATEERAFSDDEVPLGFVVSSIRIGQTTNVWLSKVGTTAALSMLSW